MGHEDILPDWEKRVVDLWADFEATEDDDFRALVEGLALEAPDDAVADFERACSWDSTGHPERAVQLYRSALAQGLTGSRRRRAAIQLASSLRNVGFVDDAVRLLEEERDRTSDELDDAVLAFLALALVDADRPVEGASIAVEALAAHLPRYQRSVAAYGRLLLGEG